MTLVCIIAYAKNVEFKRRWVNSSCCVVGQFLTLDDSPDSRIVDVVDLLNGREPLWSGMVGRLPELLSGVVLGSGAGV